MKFCFAAAALLLLAAPVQAAVYKCTNAAGTVEFKDKPCAPGSGGEITVKGVEPARAAGDAGADSDADASSNSGASGKRGGGAKKLEGRWCEYAVSMEIDGEKDEGTPAEWNFIGDKVEYKIKGAQVPLQARLQSNAEGGFIVDHPVFGGAEAEWQIVRVRGGEAVMQSPIIGYYHLRKGGCS